MDQGAAKRVLYLGDGDAQGAAAYLLAVGHEAGYEMLHVPTGQALSVQELARPCALVVLSDYPYSQLDAELERALIEAVRAGTGLMMLGGWSSFHGQNGHWDRSELAKALPVQIQSIDDRVHCDQGAIALALAPHPITQGLPFAERPPQVGGFNRVKLGQGATPLLDLLSYRLGSDGAQGWEMTPIERVPLLAVGRYGQGHTLCLMTDLAPHWVGPWVDWGQRRWEGAHPKGRLVEVGDLYARFVARLLDWGTSGTVQNRTW